MVPKRRYSVAVTLAVLLCFVPLGAVATAQAQNDGIIEITFSTWLGSPRFEKYVEWANEYMSKRYPNVRVVGTTTALQSGGYMQNLTTMFIGGLAPDLYFFGLPNLTPEWINMGFMMPITDLLEAEPELKADIHPLILDAWTYNGELYAMPTTMAPYAMFYNRYHFADVGLDRPDDNWTMFNEFRNIIYRLTRDIDGDGAVDRYGYQLQTNMSTRLMNDFMSNGAHLVDPEVRYARTTEPEFVEVLEFYHNLVRDGVITESNNLTTFVSAETSMFASGIFHQPEIQRLADFEWGIVHIPSGKAGRKTIANINAWAVNPNSPHKELAWELAKGFSSEEFARFALAEGLEFPVSMNAIRTTFMETLPPHLSPREAIVWIEALDDINPFPIHGLMPELLSRSTARIRQLVRNPSLSPGVVAQQLADEIHGLINDWYR